MRVVKLVNPDGSITELRRYDATGRDLHIDGPLSNILINYRPGGFIADQIFPEVPVGKQSDLYFEFAQSDLWRIPNTVRAPLTAAKRVDLNVASATFFCRNYALATGISLEDAVNADEVLSLRENKSRFLKDLMSLDWENRVAALVINTSNVGTFATVGSTWNDRTNANPIDNIDTAIERIRDVTGYKPNNCVFGWKAWKDFRRNANVRTLVFPAAGGGAGPGLVTLQHVAQLFDLERVNVGGVMRNTAAEGLSMSLADVWGPHVLLYYTPQRASKETPSYGYSFRWRRPGIPDMAVEDLGYDKILKGEMMEVGYYQDEKVIAKNLGTVLASVTTG
jgi:hypothetical protein